MSVLHTSLHNNNGCTLKDPGRGTQAMSYRHASKLLRPLVIHAQRVWGKEGAGVVWGGGGGGEGGLGTVLTTVYLILLPPPSSPDEAFHHPPDEAVCA